MARFLHRLFESPFLFPLIKQIKDDLLGFGPGVFSRLGKGGRRTLPHFSALRTNQVENKFFLIGAIDQMFPDKLFHRTLHLSFCLVVSLHPQYQFFVFKSIA